jgi:endoglucanase
MQTVIGRRQMLAGLLATAAWPAAAQLRIGPMLAVPPCPTGRMAQPARLSFAGPDRVILLVRDSEIERPLPRTVPLSARIQTLLDPTGRFGGAGLLDGEPGNFSGRSHFLAPQLFRPWSRLRRDTVLPIFDPGFRERFGPADADNLETWDVTVDGVQVGVSAVHRKTLPVGSAWTAPEQLATSRRHLVTLTLSEEIPEAATVRVAARGMAPVSAERSDSLASELVHVCHAGYALAGPKKGYVGLWLGADQAGESGNSDGLLFEGQGWRLVAAGSGTVVAEGELALAMAAETPHDDDRNFNGCSLFEADFSEVATEGRYRLEIAGIGSSVAFAVAADPFAEVFRLAARWYYHQRSGCEISDPHGEGRLRPRNGHPDDGLTVWQTDVKLGPTSEGYGGPDSSDLLAAQPVGPGVPTNPFAWGGWHDAGDWDRRIQHMDAVYMMAHLVERYASARALDMNIPESGRPFAHPDVAARKAPNDRGDGRTVLPDLIHEALWGISLWRRTQTEEGGIIGGVEYSLDGILGSVSWNPVQRAYAYAPEEWAAYRFVMAAAKLGHVVETVCGDKVLGAALKAEAAAAWTWAEAELARKGGGDDEPAREDAGDDESAGESAGDATPAISGEVLEARVLAAASLYRATGLPEAAVVFERLNPFKPEAPEEAPEQPLAVVAHICFDYVSAGGEGRAINQPVAQAIAQWSSWAYTYGRQLGADYGLHSTDLYRWGVGWYRFGPGSNWPAGQAGLHLLASGNAEAIADIVLSGLWFGLGCNPSNTCFVQGLGARDFADPLVVDFDGLCPVPGMISIGVAAGELREFERDGIAGALYPAEADWPPYARIWESRRVISCAEHAMRDNVMEWLHGAALAHELLARRCASSNSCPG